jgi:pimeloyl-ACP methyl ester carboxylesterase
MVLPYAWHGSGETLVLIAGLGAKGTSWHPFLERAADRFRVLTFDNRGSGAAPALAGAHSLRDFARDALALLDELGVERARVMGRSMGGMIAQELALLAPERVERLVLVSTTARVDAHLSELFSLWADMAEQGVPAALRHRSSLLWCLGRRSLAERARVKAYLAAKVRGERTADYVLQARACAEHDALERLAALRVPTLVVAGSDDRFTPRAHTRQLAGAIAGARLQWIPGTGHLPYLEEPERFAQAVLPFLELPARPAALRPRAEAKGRRGLTAKRTAQKERSAHV